MKKAKLIRPTVEENRAINAGIESDPDTYVPSDIEFKAMRPFRLGRPKLASPKKHVNLRLDAAIVEGYRATGSGWQTRMNDVLRASLKHIRPTGKKAIRRAPKG